MPKSVTTSAPAMSSSWAHSSTSILSSIHYLETRTVPADFIEEHVVGNIPLERELGEAGTVGYHGVEGGAVGELLRNYKPEK